jgi:hypothetical protein
MFDFPEGKLLLAILIMVSCLLIAIPFIYMNEQADSANMILRCESHGGALLKNTYRVGKSTSTTWVCVKPDIIIEM